MILILGLMGFVLTITTWFAFAGALTCIMVSIISIFWNPIDKLKRIGISILIIIIVIPYMHGAVVAGRDYEYIKYKEYHLQSYHGLEDSKHYRNVKFITHNGEIFNLPQNNCKIIFQDREDIVVDVYKRDYENYNKYAFFGVFMMDGEDTNVYKVYLPDKYNKPM